MASQRFSLCHVSLTLRVFVMVSARFVRGEMGNVETKFMLSCEASVATVAPRSRRRERLVVLQYRELGHHAFPGFFCGPQSPRLGQNRSNEVLLREPLPHLPSNLLHVSQRSQRNQSNNQKRCCSAGVMMEDSVKDPEMALVLAAENCSLLNQGATRSRRDGRRGKKETMTQSPKRNWLSCCWLGLVATCFRNIRTQEC
ncbi:hypothetical protein C8J56DRAFT_479345 [Mycena floridula]|nr:hypothetical protein C8J56DRAFT_479345 [Mycena floridula]